VENNYGCHATDSIWVEEHPKPNLSLPAMVSCCEGEAATIDAGIGFIDYLWSTGDSINSITVTMPGMYWITVMNQFGCEASDTVNVFMYPTPNLNIPPMVSICDGDPAILDAGEGFTNYYWSTGDTTSTIIVSDPGNYDVTVLNEFGCSASAEVVVDVSSTPEINLPVEAVLCFGSSALLDAGNEFFTYLWSTGDTNRITWVTTPGAYWLKVSNAGGCENSDTMEVIQFPQPGFLSVNMPTAGTIVLEGIDGTPPYEFAIEGNNYQLSNEFIGLFPGSYTFYIRDFNGCENDTLAIIPEMPIEIPNFFTPNGDNIHDTWEIEGLYQFPDAMVMIFDRYGKLLITYKGADKGWDGTYNNQPVPSDTYWYQVSFNDGQPAIAGDVTIKR
nr:T9SS type B sorting domain-containing protein [Bacteroidota bacterium]